MKITNKCKRINAKRRNIDELPFSQSIPESTSVVDLTSDNCRCFEYVCDTETEDDQFLDMPHISGSTAKLLSTSNLPSTGVFRSKCIKHVSSVSLPSAWRDIPVKSITDKSGETSHRAFDTDYISFFSDILKKMNPHCCWIFKKNYIKKENSRKKSCPYWRGLAICKYGDVSVQMKIENRNENLLQVRFSGDVCHDVTSAKAKKIAGNVRAERIEHAWETNAEPSKMHRDSLLEIDPNSFFRWYTNGSWASLTEQ